MEYGEVDAGKAEHVALSGETGGSRFMEAYLPVRDQIAMWLAVLLWGAAPCAAFLAQSRAQCLGIFVLANAAAFGAWKVLQ